MKADNILKGLNDKQMEAVSYTEGPLLVLAGAGSGKTRVITHRIAYLIARGVPPWNILAITFTNKAAKEMRDRVNALLSLKEANAVWVSTFHAMCVRLLRRDIDKLGFERDFTIYDTDDQKTLMKGIIKAMGLDNKIYRERSMLNLISKLKNDMLSPDEFENSAADFYDQNAAKIYREYEKNLRGNNALDFDDLLLKQVKLFKQYSDVLKYWQERFKYILIDEYQDTNNVQFSLVSLLSQKYKNLCVVGDDDQSIYKFRGANIENILNFEKTFPGAKVIKLEQNYRSTTEILNVANEVIKNNSGRKEKRLWTRNTNGNLPSFREFATASEEAEEIIKNVTHMAHEGINLKNQAVLYRTNAQSRLLEEECVAKNVPYVIVGGVNFYQRREIKDVLAYLRLIANKTDDLSLRRIINVPKRGIGETTVNKVTAYALAREISFYDALVEVNLIPGIGSAAKKIERFTQEISGLRNEFVLNETDLSGFIGKLIYETGYIDELKKEDPVSFETRLENIEELKNRATIFENERTMRINDLGKDFNEGFEPVFDESTNEVFDKATELDTNEEFELIADEKDLTSDNKDMLTRKEDSLTRRKSSVLEERIGLLATFLEDVSLVSDIDRKNDTDDVLTMMTLHAAKGLEFDTVYISGMEEGLFPSSASINSDDPKAEIEEERRLCYVGMTRAKRKLMMSSAKKRMVNGEMRCMKVSRFVNEIPDNMAIKHFFNGSRFSFENMGFNYGGYESRVENELELRNDYTSLKRSYNYFDKNHSYNDTDENLSYFYSEEKAYSAYNSFAPKVYGKYGSLDHSRLKKTHKFSSTDLRITFSDTDKKSSASNRTQIKSAASISKQEPDYAEGDRVKHVKFGYGIVKNITEGQRDYKVTVDFDDYGIKVMYAAFARLIKS